MLWSHRIHSLKYLSSTTYGCKKRNKKIRVCCEDSIPLNDTKDKTICKNGRFFYFFLHVFAVFKVKTECCKLYYKCFQNLFLSEGKKMCIKTKREKSNKLCLNSFQCSFVVFTYIRFAAYGLADFAVLSHTRFLVTLEQKLHVQG